MSIKRLKDLEDLITQSELLKTQYEVKRSTIRDEEFDELLSLIEENLTDHGFTIATIPNGIKGTYGSSIITATKNLEKSDAEKGLSLYMDFTIEGTVEEEFSIIAYDASSNEVIPEFDDEESEGTPEEEGTEEETTDDSDDETSEEEDGTSEEEEDGETGEDDEEEPEWEEAEKTETPTEIPKDAISIKTDQMQQLVDFYNKFIDSEVDVIYVYSLRTSDASYTLESVEDLINKLFVS